MEKRPIKTLQPYPDSVDHFGHYAVYIMASDKYGTLYIGSTSELIERVYKHRNKLLPGFTARYNVTRLMHFEQFSDVESAIRRERRLKKWNRDWKIRLIEDHNPHWIDLYPSIVTPV